MAAFQNYGQYTKQSTQYMMFVTMFLISVESIRKIGQTEL